MCTTAAPPLRSGQVNVFNAPASILGWHAIDCGTCMDRSKSSTAASSIAASSTAAKAVLWQQQHRITIQGERHSAEQQCPCPT